MIRKKIIKEESAISPIIGTILMVAITVIMAAIISSWSSGIKAPQNPSTVGLDMYRTSQNTIQVTLTSLDPPNPGLTWVNFTEPANPTSYRLNASKANANASDANDYLNYTNSFSKAEPAIGYSATLNVSDYNAFITGVATFTDGTHRTVYSQRI